MVFTNSSSEENALGNIGINVLSCKLWTPRTALAVVWADNVHPKSCDETKIDSHAHVERDRCNFYPIVMFFNFNSHAHVERDWDFKRVSLQDYNFNSHAHVERDIVIYKQLQPVHDFNSHAHVERDTSQLERGR